MGDQALTESLELRLERLNRLADANYQKIQRFYNGGLTVSEAYREGVLFVEVHLFSVHGEFKVSGKSLMVDRNSGRQLHSENRQTTVFVRVGDGAQGLRPLDSIVRLQLSDCPDVIVAKATKIRIPPLRVKELPTVLNRELGSVLNGPAVKNCQLIDDVIECGPEIMNAVADGETEKQRDNQGAIERNLKAVRRARIVLDGNFIYVGFPEGVKHLTKFIEVFCGPLYPDGSPIESMRHGKELNTEALKNNA